MAKVRIRKWITEALGACGGRGTAWEILGNHECLRYSSVYQVHSVARRMGLPREKVNGAVYYSLPLGEV